MIQNVYASLVVLLGYTEKYTRTDQWRNHARYEVGDRMICGFRQIERDGELEFVLCFGTEVGHLIVNHGDRHQPLAIFSEALRKEIEDCDLAIAADLGRSFFRTDFYRPACGLWTATVKRMLFQLNKRVLPVTHFGWDTNVTRDDLAIQNPEVVSRQLDEILQGSGNNVWRQHSRWS